MSTAIDLYAGIGGWAVGFGYAGITIAQAYEWWDEACRTYDINVGHRPTQADIRHLAWNDLPLPGTIDFVVGSPPCTQFSYSNRGGNGDLAEGLRDLHRFLEIVEYLRPRYWAMENVPRVSKVLREQTQAFGSLRRFADLIESVDLIDASDFGVPQSRTRMIAGRYPRDLFMCYRGREPRRTLGDVVEALGSSPATDPVYGSPLAFVTDHLVEPPLTVEETRLNRDMKSYHPVYNGMSFPDRFDRPSRTITATCTRVSRESVVISGRDRSDIRRLTIRERACVQSFPCSYLFDGRTYGSRMKMVGNAIPPAVTYYLGLAMQRTNPDSAPLLASLAPFLPALPATWSECAPERPPKRYPVTRRFRACVPGLRFKSGVRFEVTNEPAVSPVAWNMAFYYGNSKDIRRGKISRSQLKTVLATTGVELRGLDPLLLAAETQKPTRELADGLQKTWAHLAAGSHPFDLVDGLGSLANQVKDALRGNGTDSICRACMLLFPGLNRGKSSEDYVSILAGAIVMAGFDSGNYSEERKDDDKQLLFAFERA